MSYQPPPNTPQYPPQPPANAPEYPPPTYPPRNPPVPSDPGPKRRPGMVTLASWLMIFIAALHLISAITSLATMNQVRDRFRERAGATDASRADVDNLASGLQAIMIGTSVLAVLLALALIALALGNLRGSNVSRILTWVVCAFGVLCGCCGLFSVLGQTNATTFGTPDMDAQTAEELGRALRDAYPDWWVALTGGLSGLQLLGYIAIAILLALPAANAFFRKTPPPAQWQPPPPTT